MNVEGNYGELWLKVAAIFEMTGNWLGLVWFNFQSLVNFSTKQRL